MTFATAEAVLAHLCPDCDARVSASAAVCTECGAERPRGGWRLDPHLGRVIAGRYRLLDRLGSGGMGQVYLAEDRAQAGGLGPVVVKLLAERGGSADNRRFTNEARAARQLTSPHSVKVYDFGFEDGVPYLVMEYLRGKTLRQLLIERGRLDLERAIDVALQVCRAMTDAHAAGIVHRDLKPDNLILLEPDHRFVKVLDFGAARLSGIDATRSVIGTPRYMSPEQILERELDGRADIYALGASLFEMLAGRPPFDSKTLAGCLNAHLSAPVPSLWEHAPEVPPKLSRLVSRMLAKSPADRPLSMTDVEGELSEPMPPACPTRSQTRRVAVLVAVVLAASAALGAWLLGPGEQQSARAPAAPAELPVAGDPAPPAAPVASNLAATEAPIRPPIVRRAPKATEAARAVPSAPRTPAVPSAKPPRSGGLSEEDFALDR
jgi:predicted Ser/Thr protein kinase